MTESEFITETSRIEQYYDKDYTDEQRRIMYEELREFSIERYRQLTKAVIRKSKYLPKIADFEEANLKEPYINQNDDKKIECKKCNSTGYVIYSKIIKDGDKKIINKYGALCNCGNAKKYEGWNIPDKRFKSEYYTPLAKELNL